MAYNAAMNITPLSTLKGRWPNDQVVVTTQFDARNFQKVLSAERFWDDLKLDESDGLAIARFAAENGMAYAQYCPKDLAFSKSYAPAWIGMPTPVNPPILLHEVKGKLRGYDIVFCLEYSPSAVQDKARDATADPHTRHLALSKRSIIRVTLPKIFPQMVLDSHKNDKSYISSIPVSVKTNQKVSLEGDFGRYFDFFAPVGLQVNTLTVLAPNFMQVLVAASATFDVEFYGNEIVLVTRDPIYDPIVMQEALAALDAQLNYMDRLLLSWNYRPHVQPFDPLEYSYFNGEVVKLGPLRIRPGALLALLLLGFIAFGFLIVLIK